MPKYGFHLSRTFPYEDRISNSVFIRENMGQIKIVFCHITISILLGSMEVLGMHLFL